MSELAGLSAILKAKSGCDGGGGGGALIITLKFHTTYEVDYRLFSQDT